MLTQLFKIQIVENVKKVFTNIQKNVKTTNDLFSKTNNTVKLLPNSIQSLTNKIEILKQKQSSAYTTQGIKHYRTEIQKTERELDKLNKIATKTPFSLKNMFGGMGKSIIGLGAGYLGIQAITQGVTSSISTLAEFEKYNAVLTNTLGSQELAANSMEMIKSFASSTPFEVNVLTDSFVKLANRGFVPTVEEMTKLGDLASSTGKTFDQLTEAVLDAQTGEFERLKEFGITASANGDKVKFTFKGVTTEVAKTDSAIKDYILSLGSANGVQGSMASIMETTGGKLSNLQDNLTMLKLNIGEALKPMFDIFFKYAMKGVSWLADLFKGLSMAINGTTDKTKKLSGVMKVAFNITKFIKDNITAIKILAGIIASVIIAVKIWTAVQWLLNIALNANPVGLIVAAIVAFIALITLAWRKSETFRGVILGVWEAMKKFGDILYTIIFDRIKLMLHGIGEIAKALEKLSKGDFSGAWESLKKGASDYLGFTTVQKVVQQSKELKTSYATGFAKGKNMYNQEGQTSLTRKRKEIETSDITTDNTEQPPSGDLGIKPSGIDFPKGDSPSVVGNTKNGGDRFLNIGKLVEKIEIHTMNLKEGTQQIKQELMNVLLAAVNDTYNTA
jgi:F0F1-type ATP synthase assembly protein I